MSATEGESEPRARENPSRERERADVPAPAQNVPGRLAGWVAGWLGVVDAKCPSATPLQGVPPTTHRIGCPRRVAGALRSDVTEVRSLTLSA